MEAYADALRRGYDALNRRDLSDVFGLIGADFVSESRTGEKGRGAESFERFLRSWLDSFQDFHIEPKEVIDRGEQLVAIVRQTGRGRASGVEVAIRIAHAWTIRPTTSTPEQWPSLSGDDRDLVFWALASLMVAEERITTKFSGLVGAYATEEEATFLATQQVDEARHMQFYARFQDEVIGDPAAIAAHVARAREQLSPAFSAVRCSTRHSCRPTNGWSRAPTI
jgi:ketosteroid isomerase-like protein